MPTNKHNIDSLFEKAKSDIGNLDDFEKDAIAGIENYSSIKNVKELQNNLKRRFEEEILKKSRKNPPTFYWLTAATLVFLIGLSVFFIFNSTQKISKSKNLAINTTKENVSYSKTKISENTTELAKSITPQSNSNSLTNRAIENNASLNLSKKSTAENDNEKNNKKERLIISNKIIVSENEAQKDGQDKSTFTEKNNNIVEEDIAFVTKNNQVIMATPSVNSPENKSELLKSENINKSRETKKVEADEFVNCYYRGGEAEIIKDISNKLNSKKSSLKFDVIIFINQNKTVKNVEFINSYSLTEIDRKEIIAVIKSLNKFDFFMPPTTKNNYKYKLSYNP